MPAIDARDRKRILECLAGHFEADAVLADVACRFVVPPLELVILHKILLSSSFSTFGKRISMASSRSA
jgi:hypothetical protein